MRKIHNRSLTVAARTKPDDHTRRNRWLKLLAWLLVFVIIVMLLIPSELSNQELLQVQPGMTMEQVKELLGEPWPGPWDLGILVEKPDGYCFTLKKKGKFWRPTIAASVEGMSLASDQSRWIGKTHLLWVEHNNGIVTKTCMFPITRTGGGFQGCIDSIVEYWNNR